VIVVEDVSSNVNKPPRKGGRHHGSLTRFTASGTQDLAIVNSSRIVVRYYAYGTPALENAANAAPVGPVDP